MTGGIRFNLFAFSLTLMAASALSVRAGSELPLPTTLEDFFLPGSQPSSGVVYAEFITSGNCAACHEYQGLQTDAELTDIYPMWAGSMMAHSVRDPVFQASLAIANQDAAFAGDLCLRCHTPSGWIQGRSEPTDGSALTIGDRDGVSCSVCHRMVDPVFEFGVSPPPDGMILANLDDVPTEIGGGNFVLDPEDRRRGPFDLAADGVDPSHPWLESPFHTTSDHCATCHDVSNPAFMRQEDGSYDITNTDEAHPTGSKYDMFPLERTYSEWLMSDYAVVGVDTEGRFGGNEPVVSTCQDCHMPAVTGKGCLIPGVPTRDNIPSHELAGGNAWVQDMIANLYPDEVNVDYLEAGKQRAISMLQRACSLEVWQEGNQVFVRITNESGHKLPSGYPEGRRMWINVRFLDSGEAVLDERGSYDDVTALLETSDTKVYEIKLGIDEHMSGISGKPVGESFNFVLNNMIVKDNRIPPRGFTNAAFEAVQAKPVAYDYEDGQFWDDTGYRLPWATAEVEVAVYYQTSSREFIEFLRDENVTNDAGDVLYAQWELTGKSPPVEMASASLVLDPFPNGDGNGDEMVTLSDYFAMQGCLVGPLGSSALPACAPFDFDVDTDVDLRDVAEMWTYFGE